MEAADKFYLTTAIAYANNKPGLHTLYEVIGADVLARWNRLCGRPTRFLTGTDEHSVNIAQRAAAEGIPTAVFVDEKVALFRQAQETLLIRPDRFIRTSDPDHIHAAQELVRRAYAAGDIYFGKYEGWYCPAEGFKTAADVESPTGPRCPDHPGLELLWLSEPNWFFKLSAYQKRLEAHFAAHPDFVAPAFRRNEVLGLLAAGPEDFSISRTGSDWGIPFPLLPDGSSSLRPDGSYDPAAGTIYVWFDALANYLTGAGFPHDQASFSRWWPADLQIIGKDISKFHALYWPAILWSAGLEATKSIWVHGWLLSGGDRHSKSRGNFLDPLEKVNSLGADGIRYAALREVPFDADAEATWPTFIHRYNTDLANNWGNLHKRVTSLVNLYLGGVRQAPSGQTALATLWPGILATYSSKLEARLLHEALGGLWSFCDAANRLIEVEKPWALAKVAADETETPKVRAAARARLAAVLGDLAEACRLFALASAPFLPATAPVALGQLGYPYPYDEKGAGGPPIAEELRWGAHASETGIITPANAPLFPRLPEE